MPPATYYFVLVLYFTLVSDNLGEEKKHKISMVSSPSEPGTPALFTHGESPVWDSDTQSLYFVDVLGQNIHRLDYHTGKIHTKHITYGQVNVVSLVAGSRRLLVAVRAGLYLLDWAVRGDAALRLLATVDDGMPDNVINEGKSDPDGRYWFGTKGPQMGDDVTPDRATLFSISQESIPHTRIQLRPISISNGLVWALNHSVLYYIDSSTQKVEAFDYDVQKGDISARRTIFDVTDYGYEDAVPDGMTIDSDGKLWVALMFGGAVLHIDPEIRQLVFSYKLPVTRVTSCAWGGPGRDELFVTTARDSANVKAEPLSGAIFTIRGTGSRGVPDFSFHFDHADVY